MSPARLEELSRNGTVAPVQQAPPPQALAAGEAGVALAEAARLLKENGERVQRLG